MHIDIFHRSYFVIVLIFVTLGVWIAQEMQSGYAGPKYEPNAPSPARPFQG